MAASQNARSGSTPKTHRRSRPPIQTCDPDRSRPHDPDRSRPHDPDLWSRPLCFMLVGHVLFQSTEKHYSVLQSTMLGDLVNFGKIWPSRSRPRSRPFQTRSRPVPWNPRAVSIHSHVAQEAKTGLCVQCRIIWFSLSRIWNDYHDSRHSVPDVRKRHFTKVVVPDVRIIAERSRPVYRPMPICRDRCLSPIDTSSFLYTMIDLKALGTLITKLPVAKSVTSGIAKLRNLDIGIEWPRKI